MSSFLTSSFRCPAKQTWALPVLLGLVVLNAFAQQPTSSSNAQITHPVPQSAPIPDYVLYHQFFRHLLYLDNQAARRQANSTNSDETGNSYQKRLRFNTDQFAKVRSSANATEQQVAALDGQAKGIIVSFRAQHQHVSPSEPLPAPPAELAQLQQQRNALIQAQVTQLKASLGSQAATQLDGFLRTQFAPHVRIALLGPPRAHNPSLHPVAPFERIR